MTTIVEKVKEYLVLDHSKTNEELLKLNDIKYKRVDIISLEEK